MERPVFRADGSSRERLKGLALGYLLFSEIKNDKTNETVDSAMQAACNAIQAKFKDPQAVADDTVISATRRFFSSIGRDPAKERPSGEALIRRVATGKGIYRISATVDINNILSLLTGFPCGVYDADKLEGEEITVLIGPSGTIYAGLGGREVEAGGRLLVSDSASIFGGPTADSSRSQVTAETTRALMLIYCPPGIEMHMLKATMDRASKLMQHGASAKEAARGILVVE